MNNIEKIGRFEIIAIFITIISNNVIVNLPNVLLNFSGTGAWINVIYITAICLLFTLLICKFFKPFVSFDILDVSEYLGKKPLKIIIGIAYIALFISFTAVCFRYFINSLQFIYFNSFPLVYLILLILIPAVIASRYGLKSVSGANLIFMPVAVIAIIVLFIAASRDFVWQRIFPVLGYGAKETFLHQSSNIFILNVVSYLYFIKPFLKKETDFKKISIFAVIVCGIYLLVSIISLLMTFAFVAGADENFSLYLLTRLVSFGKFLQRVDAIFIFIWILNTMAFISFNLFIVSHIIKKILNLESFSPLVYPSTALLFSATLLFKNLANLRFFYRNYYKFYSIILVFVVSLIIFCLAYIKKRKEGMIDETK